MLLIENDRSLSGVFGPLLSSRERDSLAVDTQEHGCVYVWGFNTQSFSEREENAGDAAMNAMARDRLILSRLTLPERECRFPVLHACGLPIHLLHT